METSQWRLVSIVKVGHAVRSFTECTADGTYTAVWGHTLLCGDIHCCVGTYTAVWGHTLMCGDIH